MTTSYSILQAVSSIFGGVIPLSSPLGTSTLTDPVDSAPPSTTIPTPSPTSLTTIPTISTLAPTPLAAVDNITTPAPTALASTITTSTPTSTSPATDPSFSFLLLNNVTICGVYTIRWTVSNPNPANLTGVAIDFEVAGIGNNVSFTIAANLPVLSANYTWNPVNVPPGQYEIYGRWSDTNGSTVQSPVFDVKSGNTTACLANTRGISSAAASPSSPNKAAIVGGTFGGIIFLVCLAFAFRRVSRRKPGGRGGGGGLGSLGNAATASRDIDGKNNNLFAPGNMTPHARFRGGGGGGATASIASLDSLEKIPITPPPATGMLPTADTKLNPIPGHRPTPELSFPRSSLDLYPTGGRGGSDAGDGTFQALSSHCSSRTTPMYKPVPACTPTLEELEYLALARSRSEQTYPHESGGGTTFLDMMTTISSSPSPPPSPGVPLPPSSPSSFSMSLPARRSSWSTNPPLRGIFDGH